MTSRRPTKRAAVMVLIGGLLLLAASTAQAGWLFVLAAGVLAPTAASLITRQRLTKTRIVRSMPSRARVGDEIRVGIAITAEGSSLPLGRLIDPFPAFEPTTIGIEPAPAHTTQHIELVKRAERRGVFDSAEVELVSGAPFGLARSRARFPVSSEITVVPSWVELSTFPILEPSSSPTDVVHERARTGAGEEYLGVREYRPGDPRRFVHWRSTARAGKLIVREYEQEVASRLGLVLAGDDFGTAPDSAFEALVSATASIGLYALSTGHPVDAVRADPDGAAHLGSPGRHELLDWLAGARPTDIPLTGLVQHVLTRIGRRGTIVLLAPDGGNAGRSLHDAIQLVQSAGARAIVVVARARSWDDHSAIEATQLPARAPVRYLARGEDMVACLQG